MTYTFEPFRYLISLGYNCGAAYQIRLHTRIAEPYFFDWLYTSADAAAKVIEGRFEDFMLKENLSIVRDNTEVLETKYGIRFNHSFKNNGVGPVLLELMDRDYETERAKFMYMASKFMNAMSSGLPMAFIRYNPENIDPIHQIERLSDVLRRNAKGRTWLYWIQNGVTELFREDRDGFSIIGVCERPERSRSFRNRDFIRTDDTVWGEFLATLSLDLIGRKLADKHPVLFTSPTSSA